DREEILKQLTCAISHEDFDEKSTKPPLASSTVYEMSSDENSFNGKTTKTWIWTSNTVDIDYGMPTRHRRETEDTLSPISTKSTTGLSTIKQIYQKKVTATESFTTPATNYDTEVTTNSLESDSTLDSSVAKIPDKSIGLNQIPENLTTQDVNTHQEEQAEMISVTLTSSAETKFTEHDVDDTGAEYSSAINQGQLFSIIENGTMFDIIELNDTTTDADLKTSQEFPSTQETESKKSKIQSTEPPSSTVTSIKEYIDNKLHIKDIKSRKKDIYKLSDSKKMYKVLSTISPKPIEENQSTNIINKEVELYPIVRDPSLKLNRTFRKELPPIPEDYSEIDTGKKLGSKLIDLSISNDLSNPVSEHIEIKLQGKSKNNITETLFITTSRRHIENSKGQIEPNTTKHITEEIEISEGQNNELPKYTAEIDPRIDVLNMNLTKNNESEMVDNSLPEKVKEIPHITLPVTKKQFLPKSLAGGIEFTVTTTNSEFTDVSEDPLETQPEEQPRPNRQRQLTRPQRRSFYPYFFSRVLG
ncbi:uncharacterized protein LOC108912566, partial [Anoplophora glabripennis]|uniref:uncharacterized protein LOC108912566 n=1 Tax=Anoplophora glabripennis TaxID=217634 RepID=UPI000874D353